MVVSSRLQNLAFITRNSHSASFFCLCHEKLSTCVSPFSLTQDFRMCKIMFWACGRVRNYTFSQAHIAHKNSVWFNILFHTLKLYSVIHWVKCPVTDAALKVWEFQWLHANQFSFNVMCQSDRRVLFLLYNTTTPLDTITAVHC